MTEKNGITDNPKNERIGGVMKTYTVSELNNILKAHGKWLAEVLKIIG